MKVELNEMLKMQEVLDQKILKAQNIKESTYSERLLALIVELGECANEWKGFKFWKVNPLPNTRALRKPTMNPEDKEYYNPLLEEYVDILHFILSVGNSLEVDRTERKLGVRPWKAESISEQFILITGKAYELFKYEERHSWEILFRMFIALGELMGFTWQDIKEAYFDKNQINHERQAEGY